MQWEYMTLVFKLERGPAFEDDLKHVQLMLQGGGLARWELVAVVPLISNFQWRNASAGSVGDASPHTLLGFFKRSKQWHPDPSSDSRSLRASAKACGLACYARLRGWLTSTRIGTSGP
jgi:hypothetical protein